MNILGNSGIESNADGMWPGAQYPIAAPVVETGDQSYVGQHCQVEERRSREVPNGTLLMEEALNRWKRLGSSVVPSYESAVQVVGAEGVIHVVRQSLRVASSSNNLAGKVRRRGKLPALHNLALDEYRQALRSKHMRS